MGMGSVLSAGSYMEEGSILGAHSVLRPFQRVPHGQVWAGNPARYLRDVSEEETLGIEKGADHYYQTSLEHGDAMYLSPPMELYREAEEKGYSVGVVENPNFIQMLRNTREKLRNALLSRKE